MLRNKKELLGRDLDMEIARRLFKKVVVWDDGWKLVHERTREYLMLPSYSTDVKAVQKVVEFLKSHDCHYVVELNSQEPPETCCRAVVTHRTTGVRYVRQGSSIPETTCRVALDFVNSNH